MKRLTMLAFLFASLTAFAQTGYQVGDKAKDFKLPNIDGNTVSLADYADAKGFIVVFTCNHCPYAVKNEARLNTLNEKYKPLGFPVIAVNPTNPERFPDNDLAGMKQRAQERSFSFPYLQDASQEIGKAYGATKTPHAYVLQKEGANLTVRYIGAIDDSVEDPSAVKAKYVGDAVDALLAGKSVAKTSSKAIGCGIQYK